MPPLALVTGGCRRLGAAIAGRLAKAGYTLALHGHHDAEPEAALAPALAGVEWRGFVADFADAGAAEQLFGDVVTHFGRAPDLLVNSASSFGQDRIDSVTATDLRLNFAVNCAAPTLLTRAFPAAAGEGRAIVNILDQRIRHPHGDQLAYTLSKLALAGLTDIAAREFAPAIRVNAVAPGLTIATEDYRAEQVAGLAAIMPLQRLPMPADIAKAVLFLATAKGVTGQVLFVDGGAHHVAFARDFMHLAA